MLTAFDYSKHFISFSSLSSHSNCISWVGFTTVPSLTFSVIAEETECVAANLLFRSKEHKIQAVKGKRGEL